MDEKLEKLAIEAMSGKDYVTARRILDSLAEQGSAFALATIGTMYENGLVGPIDKATAQAFYRRAIDAGDVYSHYRLGWLLLDSNDVLGARHAFEAGMELGDESCKSALKDLDIGASERIAFEAMSVRDWTKAEDALMPIAHHNSEYTLMTLGWLHESGLVGMADTALAISFYERAAKIGCINGYYRAGLLHIDQGLMAEARSSFAHGVDLGHLASMERLGEMMLEGQGGVSDPDQGLALLKLAADRGHIMAMRKLLVLEAASTNSILKKISIRMKLAKLAKVAVDEFILDEFSPKVEGAR